MKYFPSCLSHLPFLRHRPRRNRVCITRCLWQNAVRAQGLTDLGNVSINQKLPVLSIYLQFRDFNHLFSWHLWERLISYFEKWAVLWVSECWGLLKVAIGLSSMGCEVHLTGFEMGLPTTTLGTSVSWKPFPVCSQVLGIYSRSCMCQGSGQMRLRKW